MVLGFFRAAEGLKETPRRGWKRLGIDRPESVADHSYAVAAISMIISDMKGLDTERMMRMALLHDLAESVTGDRTPGEVEARAKELEEDAAFAGIAAMLPVPARARCEEAWREYREGATAEAKMVRQIDRLEMALQARRYGEGGRPGTEPFLDSARDAVKDPVLAGLLGEIEGDA